MNAARDVVDGHSYRTEAGGANKGEGRGTNADQGRAEITRDNVGEDTERVSGNNIRPEKTAWQIQLGPAKKERSEKDPG